MDDEEAAERLRRIIGQSAMRSMDLTNEETTAAYRRFAEATIEATADLRLQGWSDQRVLIGLISGVIVAVIGLDKELL